MVELNSILISYLRNNVPNPHGSGNWIYVDYPRCFTEDVRVWTPKGWKRISEININEEVFVFDKKTLEIKIEPVLAKIIKYYSGPIIQINSPQLCIGLTPNHKVPIRWSSKGRVHWKEAEDLNEGMYLPCTLNWKGKSPKFIELPGYRNSWYCGRYHLSRKEVNYPPLKVPIETFLPLLGLYLSEGYLQERDLYLEISQTKKETRKKIISYLSKTPFRFSVGKEAITITDKRVGLFFAKFARLAGSKFIPQKFKNLEKKHLRLLLQWLFLGDGSPTDKSRSGFEYYTTSKQLAEDVLEIILKAGYMARLRIKEQPPYKPCYCIKKYSSWQNLKLRKHLFNSEYQGYVYCLTTPSHTLIARNKAGQIMLSGNSDATFPRISLTQTGGELRPVAIGERTQPTKYGKLASILFDIDIWVKMNDRATFDSETYVGTKLRDYLASKVIEVLEKGKEGLKSNYGILDIEILGTYSQPLDEENQLHRKTISIRVSFLWERG